MPEIYDRIRGNAQVRQQSMARGVPMQTSSPNVTGMEGMMEAPSALSKHIDTSEKAGQFSNFVEQDPQLKDAFSKVQAFAENLRQNNPDITAEEAQRQVQLFIAQELQ